MEREVLRQLIHFSGIFLVFIARIFGAYTSWLISLALFIFFIMLYIAKKKNIPYFIWLINLTSSFERKGNNYEGAIYFFLSATFVFFIFPVEIASIAIFVLCVYDSLATLSGKFLGKRRIIFKKSVEGVVCGFVFTVIFGSLIFPFHKIFLATLVGALVELIPKINDNISIPFSVALVLWGLNFL